MPNGLPSSPPVTRWSKLLATLVIHPHPTCHLHLLPYLPCFLLLMCCRLRVCVMPPCPLVGVLSRPMLAAACRCCCLLLSVVCLVTIGASGSPAWSCVETYSSRWEDRGMVQCICWGLQDWREGVWLLCFRNAGCAMSQSQDRRSKGRDSLEGATVAVCLLGPRQQLHMLKALHTHCGSHQTSVLWSC